MNDPSTTLRTLHPDLDLAPIEPGLWASRVLLTQELAAWLTEKTGFIVRAPRYRGERMPVAAIRWDEAMRLTAALTGWLRGIDALPGDLELRLPTEAEWQRAACAGTTTTWYFGEDAAELTHHAWFSGNSGEVTHPVGEKKPSPAGLYDIYGNASEWCLDEHFATPEPDLTRHDPRAFAHVIRGGACDFPSWSCTSFARERLETENPMNEQVGVRLFLGPPIRLGSAG